MHASRHSHGNSDRLTDPAQQIEGVPADHLFVNGHMDRNIVSPQGFYLLGPGHRIGDTDQIHDNFSAIIFACLDAFGNRRITGRTQNIHQIGPGLGCGFHFNTAGIHNLHVGDNGVLREMAPQFPHCIETFTFNERGSGFEPVNSGRDG